MSVLFCVPWDVLRPTSRKGPRVIFTPPQPHTEAVIVRGRYRQRTLLAAKSCSFKPARQHRAHHSSCALSRVFTTTTTSA